MEPLLLLEFDLSNNELGDEGGAHLFEYFDEYVLPVRRLELRNCGLEVNAARSLRELLRHEHYLEHVDLRENKAMEEMFDILERGRRKNPKASVRYF